MRRFYLQRGEDISGMSGTGKVAEGVEWSNGRVAVIWLSSSPSTGQYDSVTALETIHSHNGRHDTKIVWVDPKYEKVEEKAKETKTKQIEELVAEDAEEEKNEKSKTEDNKWREPKSNENENEH